MPPILATIFSRRMLVCFLMGFSCGLPLTLTMGLAQAWMKQEMVSLGVIGLITLVQMPYAIKFFWAPLFDRYSPPFLGRRRGWLFITQVLLILTIAVMGLANPALSPWLLGMAALMVAICSASQDSVVDAYRREDLADEELGLGSTLYAYGYRLGTLLAGGGGLILADLLGFTLVYALMAAFMLVGLITTLFTPEPVLPAGKPVSMKEAVVETFVEFFHRSGTPWAVMVLAFILLYKLGDSLASAMTTPFYLDIGFSMTEIGAVVKLFGFWASLGGMALGGLIMLKVSMNRCLWAFGVGQAVSTAGFALLSVIGPSLSWLAAVIAFENLTSGMGTAALLAFMAHLTNKRFTAFQYAMLTSLSAIPRVMASAPTGYLVQAMGWTAFFVFCALAAIPGLLLLLRFAPLKKAGP